MSDIQTAGESSEATSAREEVVRPRKVGPLQTEHGDTTIEDTVVHSARLEGRSAAPSSPPSAVGNPPSGPSRR